MTHIFIITEKLFKNANFFIISILFTQCASYNFDQNYFGVIFTPYVKQSENDAFPKVGTYTFDNIKTMLTVVAGKFSKVLVHGHFSSSENYTVNSTYYTDTYICVRSAEAAAQINQANGKSVLQLALYLPSVFSGKRKEVNTLLAFEAAEKANGIFAGTVQTIIFECVQTISSMEETLSYIKLYQERASQLKLKLGIGSNCVTAYSEQNDTVDATRQELIALSNVILYGIGANNRVVDPVTNLEYVTANFLHFRNYSAKINGNAEVYGWTDWSSYGLQDVEALDNFKKFWEIANTWAAANKYTLYLHEAFDNPWRRNSARAAHCGWWKLKENWKINMVEGYIEKISENANKKGEHSSSFYYWIGSTVAVSIILILIVLALVFRFLRSKRSTGLNAKEIREFIFGAANNSNLAESPSAQGSLVETALNGPYDKSLEIAKKNLKIGMSINIIMTDYSHLLGSGTFGCVFKATICKDDTDSKQAAVKVANEKCPANALKGILSEIKIMSYLGSHPNIVVMMGAYTAELTKGIVYVATELCSMGSLEKYLRRNQYVGIEESTKETDSEEKAGRKMKLRSKSSIPFNEMIQWSHEIASGMEFLEKKHVVHADLATRNVLLNAEKVAKIADFGLSRRMYNYLNYVKTHQEPLPWRWMAVESLKKMEFSSKSDVWSYGITLWEIFSNGDVPYQGLAWTPDFSEELISGLRPGRPSLASVEMYKLIQNCWSLEPNERLGFGDIACYTNRLLTGDNDENLGYLSMEEEL